MPVNNADVLSVCSPTSSQPRNHGTPIDYLILNKWTKKNNNKDLVVAVIFC